MRVMTKIYDPNYVVKASDINTDPVFDYKQSLIKWLKGEIDKKYLNSLPWDLTDQDIGQLHAMHKFINHIKGGEQE